MWPAWARALTLSVCSLASCAFEPPTAAEPFTPPPAFAAIWLDAETCSGLTGSFARITWFVVPGYSFLDRGGHPVIGHWEPPHTIYLASDWITVAWVVRHEMLHDLLQSGAHPDLPFAVPCHATWASRDSAGGI